MMSKLSPIFLIATIASLVACAHKPAPTADVPPSAEAELMAAVDTSIPPVETYSPPPDPVFPATPDETDTVVPPVKKKSSVSKAKKAKAISGVTSVGRTKGKGGGDSRMDGGGSNIDRAPASVGPATPATTPVAYPPTEESIANPETRTASTDTAAAPIATATVEEEGRGFGWMIWVFGVIIATVGAFIYHQSHKVHKSDLAYHTH